MRGSFIIIRQRSSTTFRKSQGSFGKYSGRQTFIWGTEQQAAFEKLKQLMTSANVLAYFRGDCKTRIVADAGPDGLGAVLLQLQNGEWRAVSYTSRNLTDVERRYAQTEIEALPKYEHARNSIFAFVGANSGLKRTTRH